MSLRATPGSAGTVPYALGISNHNVHLRHHRTGIFVLLAILLSGAIAACGDSDDDAAPDARSGPSDFEITGSWKGQPQREGLAPFEVTATIRDLDAPSENTVRYDGSIECRGNWAYLGREGTAYRFREMIDRGAATSCEPAGIVKLTPFDLDAVDYEFRGGGVASFGVLKLQAG
jgi:hypothetical protein